MALNRSEVLEENRSLTVKDVEVIESGGGYAKKKEYLEIEGTETKKLWLCNFFFPCCCNA